MSNIVISVENLSKIYRLGQIGTGTLSNDLKVWWARTRGKPNPLLKIGQPDHGNQAGEDLWALKDVNFTVEQGEVLGIIGRNGAGKSTLLKILSRVTAPTSGKVKVKGRVASLLEVGTGFHPDLTGRENIYLNGAILGMTRREVRRKLDEIVAFAEVEQFIDTPVKRYSSGMYVRLAFAVAAHLDPEILIVDEVLAVGDAQFQKKCLGKMGDVAAGGRTVLFVSHNMASIKSLCKRAILIESGYLTKDGRTNDVVNAYLMTGREISTTGVIPKDRPRLCNGQGLIRKVELLDLENQPISQLYFGQPVRLGITFQIHQNIKDALIEVGISSVDGSRLLSSYSVDYEQPATVLPVGWYRVVLDLEVHLLPGDYTFDMGVHHLEGTTIDFVEQALNFSVLRLAKDGTDHYRWTEVRGFIRPKVHWQKPEPVAALAI